MSDDDWDKDDEPTTAPAVPVVLPKKSRFAGEDEEERSEDDWDADPLSESEKVKPAVVAPPKKKGTLKAKLAEKEAAEKAAREAALNGGDDPMLLITPQERRRLERQQELEADLQNASDLLGSAAIEDKSLESLLTMPCKTKQDFERFSDQVYQLVIARHASNPLFSHFVTTHATQLCESLKDSEVRKTASALSVVANTKQQEQRDKVSGKKKSTKAKPTLGANKAVHMADTRVYDDALDDGDDDFM